MSLGLLLRTLPFLTRQQILHRLRFVVRRRLWRLARVKAPVSTYQAGRTHFVLYPDLDASRLSGPWASEVSKACDRARGLARRRFGFLGADVEYSDGIDWHDSNVSQLWRYHLHYFDYIVELRLLDVFHGGEVGWDAFREHVRSWITANGVLAGDGWHPYPLSLRIVNWINALGYWENELGRDAGFGEHLLDSIYGQAQVLAASLEWDVRGNHLLKNLKALLWAGSAFEGREPERWTQTALTMLNNELAEQILDDGCHFERAPGYHLTVALDCLEIAILLRRTRGGGASAWIDTILARMLRFLRWILPGNQRLPLLKDTAVDAAPPAVDVLAAGALYLDQPELKVTDHFGLLPLLLFGEEGWRRYADWPRSGESGPPSGPSSGYHIMRDDDREDFLIVDAGKVCPDYLPAHAHADALSYELTVAGHPVVVDAGVYEYQAGRWRSFFRSTRAHNTVEVEGEDQSEVWSSFRVARRAEIRRVSIRVAENHTILDASHDGYTRLASSVVHRRVIVWKRGRFWLVVDFVEGAEPVSSADHVHLAPELALDPVPDRRWCWKVTGVPLPLYVQGFGGHRAELTKGQERPVEQGWYSEAFGTRLPSQALTISVERTPPPHCVGYAFSLDHPLALDCRHESGQTRLSLVGEEVSEVVINPHTVSVLK